MKKNKCYRLKIKNVFLCEIYFMCTNNLIDIRLENCDVFHEAIILNKHSRKV